MAVPLSATPPPRFAAADKRAELWWRHPYPFAAFAWVVGFVLVFRSNNAYTRYFEALSSFHNMTGE